MEWPIMIDITKARSWARDVAATINREGAPCPIFAKANKNVVAVVALLDTLPTTSTDGVDKVYR
jgi:hypothetical protein